MSFGDDMAKFAAKVVDRQRRIFVNVVSDVRESITDGSAITGAPGQPVDTGYLKGSWQESFPETWVGVVETNAAYAPAIEEGQGPHGPLTLRSQVGGFHSVKKTVTGFGAIVDDVTRKVVQ